MAEREEGDGFGRAPSIELSSKPITRGRSATRADVRRRSPQQAAESSRGMLDEQERSESLTLFQGKCAAVFTADRIGLLLGNDDKNQSSILVRGFVPGSVAAKSQSILEGDEIVTVDGQAVFNTGVETVAALVEKTAAETGNAMLTLGIRRGEEYLVEYLYRPLRSSETSPTELPATESPTRESSIPQPRSNSKLTIKQMASSNTPAGPPLAVSSSLAQEIREIFGLTFRYAKNIRSILVESCSSSVDPKDHIQEGDILLAVDGKYSQWTSLEEAHDLFTVTDGEGHTLTRETVRVTFLRNPDQDIANQPTTYSVTVGTKGQSTTPVVKVANQILDQYSTDSKISRDDSTPMEDNGPIKHLKPNQKNFDPLQSGNEVSAHPESDLSSINNTKGLIEDESMLKRSLQDHRGDEWCEEDDWIQMLKESRKLPPFLERSSFFEVTVTSAEDLPISESNETIHTLCRLTLNKEVRYTETCSNHIKPEWNKRFIFTTNNPSSDILAISVLDRGSDNYLAEVGKIILPVDGMARRHGSVKGQCRCWFRLRDVTGNPIKTNDKSAVLELSWQFLGEARDGNSNIFGSNTPRSTYDNMLSPRRGLGSGSKQVPQVQQDEFTVSLDTTSVQEESRDTDSRTARRVSPRPLINHIGPRNIPPHRGRPISSPYHSPRSVLRNSHASSSSPAVIPHSPRVETPVTPRSPRSTGGDVPSDTVTIEIGQYVQQIKSMRNELTDKDRRVKQLEEEVGKHHHLNTIQSKELQRQQQVIELLADQVDSLTLESHRPKPDGEESPILDHVKSGAVLSSLRQLLLDACAPNDSEFNPLHESDFISDGSPESVVVANVHREIWSLKHAQQSLQDALSRAEETISERKAESIGLKAHLREMAGGMTPRYQREDNARHENGSERSEEHDDSLTEKMAAATRQIELQMVHISKLHKKLVSAGISSPEDKEEVRALITNRNLVNSWV